MVWEKYTVDNPADYVPVGKWGKDHWTTLAYLETRSVDHQGVLSNKQMRCNPRLHREFAHSSLLGSVIDGSKYPTRLRNDETLDGHDDWSCLEDMVAAGLVRAYYRVARPTLAFGTCDAKIELTGLGEEVAAQLRRHLAAGKRSSDFTPLESAISPH